jgi:hypothetical protein|tara:strand:- start:1004 stop:1135 length:132 start_codon:yes stop_codon:yes gene_type:complete
MSFDSTLCLRKMIAKIPVSISATKKRKYFILDVLKTNELHNGQ